MNKTAIKNFAVWARTNLIDAVKQKAFEYEIKEDCDYDSNLEVIAGRLLTNEEKEQRRELIIQIKNKGYEQVMEEVAYTWFNRFIALRFMEVNTYLPTRIRLFTDENGEFKPEILKEALTVELDELDRVKVLELMEKQDNEGLYKYLIITQCNALNKPLPQMFEKISNYTELLFPNNLLKPDSILARMVNDIPEEDWRDQVQIIGWLYQYYNAELKDDTFAKLKKNIKITKERIPSATQLFTPDWIVRYMIENSLGRLWYEGHNDFDKSQWKYYLDEADQEPEVQAQLDEIRAEYKNIKPEDIKIIDPCMGSGHILVYAFDVLMQIYTSAGWSERDASISILENNLYGLDIDDRASQMAYFAVMMKARQYNRRILKSRDDNSIQPNVFSIQESNDINVEYIELFEDLKPVAQKVIDVFKDAKIYGSILNINIELKDLNNLYNRYKQIADTEYDNMFDSIKQAGLRTVFLPLLNQAILLAQKYDVVCTNPPYMGASGMDVKLSKYVKDNYPDSKSDLSTCFMECCSAFCSSNGYYAMINIPVWMFLSSYEELRNKILCESTYTNMVHLGRGIFGSDFGTTSFIISKRHICNYSGVYRRLFKKQGAVDSIEQKEKWFLESVGYYTAKQENFSKIPGSPIAYWVSNRSFNIFETSQQLSEFANVPKGLSTGSVDLFMRFWYEIQINKIGLNATTCQDTIDSKFKWYPYAKGGAFRKWYGNLEYVVNWENDGYEVKHFVDEKGKQRSRPQNTTYYFKKCLTYSALTSYKLSLRYLNMCIFGGGGDSIHIIDDDIFYYIFGFINSELQHTILGIISPTINFEVDHLKKLPIIINYENKYKIDKTVKDNIFISKSDWDSFETSWDFKKHPLV